MYEITTKSGKVVRALSEATLSLALSEIKETGSLKVVKI